MHHTPHMSSWVKLAERLVKAVERLADAVEVIAATASTAEPEWRRLDEVEMNSKHEVLTRR